MSDDEVAAMTAPDGAAGFVRIAAELLAATFGDGGGEGARDPTANANPPQPQEAAPA